MIDKKENNNIEASSAEKLGARSLVKKLLEEKGVSYQEIDDGRIVFSFGADGEDGETIAVDANDENQNIRLIDYCWYEVSKWDVEDVTRIQSRVNELNQFGRGKIVYGFSDDDKMQLSSLITCYFSQNIPDYADYFVSQLNNFAEMQAFVLAPEVKATQEKQQENANKNEQGGEA